MVSNVRGPNMTPSEADAQVPFATLTKTLGWSVDMAQQFALTEVDPTSKGDNKSPVHVRWAFY